MNAKLTVYRKTVPRDLDFPRSLRYLRGAEQTTYTPNRGNLPTSTFSSNSVSDGATLATAEP